MGMCLDGVGKFAIEVRSESFYIASDDFDPTVPNPEIDLADLDDLIKALEGAREYVREKALVVAGDDDKVMIISFKHGYAGNSYLFWGRGGSSYTEIVDRAGVYTRKVALTMMDCESIAVPVEFVSNYASKVLDSQNVSKEVLLRAAEVPA